jgi:hypothetical protein
MSRKNSTVVGIGAAISGAAIAAFLSVGTAYADPAVTTDTYYDSAGVIAAGDHQPGPNDAYDILFGSATSQGIANNSLDIQDAQSNLTGYESFVTSVTSFESQPLEHGLENLIYALDPSAFYLQTTDGVTGYVAESVSGVTGAYLVPDDFLGYLATGLDYGLLSPTGLDYVLTPLIDILAGQPF